VPATQSQLGPASSAADAGAGTGDVGDPGASCHQDPPAEIAVRVQTCDGKPVEGASVSVVELSLSGTTGPDGVYDFGEVAPGTYTASGQKDTFSPSGGSPSSPATQSLPAPAGASTQYELVLDPGARMAVHVQQTDGTAVEGATVSVDGKGWAGVTDASGNFDFGAVPPDTYTITGQKDCFNPASASQTQNAPTGASTQYRLTLDPTRITSITVATSPANQARLRIGVGEEVDLTVTPGPATWAITNGSGTLAPNSGTQTNVRFTASDLAENVVITATNDGCQCTITFTVVQPSHWTMVRQPGTNLNHHNGWPDCGWMGITYFHPDDVNFYRVEDRELDSQAVGTGSFSGFGGAYHGHYPPPDNASQWFPIPSHVEGSGSTDNAPDTIYSGFTGVAAVGSAPPFNVGTLYFPITLQWRVVGSANAHNFPVVRQEHEIFADGRCETRKGSHTEHTTYNDPTSTY
jgi:hypothetical protein